MKVISFSLWGDSPKYNVGAIRNLELAHKIYPDWTPRFYVGESVPSKTLMTLAEIGGCQIVHMPEEGNWTGMFWRFEPASEADVEAMISRDCDSRLSLREAEAVHEWLESTCKCHIMRDHPHHGAKILGGMWGIRRGVIPNMIDLMNAWEKVDRWQTDQEFLDRVVYPRVWNNAMIHDEFGFMPHEDRRRFPSQRRGLEFVGSVYDENDQPVQEHLNSLAAVLGKRRA